MQPSKVDWFHLRERSTKEEDRHVSTVGESGGKLQKSLGMLAYHRCHRR
jgi:hypothetical protein